MTHDTPPDTRDIKKNAPKGAFFYCKALKLEDNFFNYCVTVYVCFNDVSTCSGSSNL